MLEIKLYTFGKRENSTARPSGGVSFQARIWDGTSVLSPDIVLAFPDNTTNPAAYNYAYIPDFGRYYFIRDWQYKNRCWIASMQVDTLASWRDSIGESLQYVVRAAAEYDGRVIDNLYPSKEIPTINVVECPQQFYPSGGVYVVGVINNAGGGFGSTVYYGMTTAQFAAFRAKLFATNTEDYPDWLGPIEEISGKLATAIFNPYDYITCCYWYPINGFVGGGVGQIPFGWWNIPGSATELSAPTLSKYWSLSIPKHPQQSRGSYLNGPGFTRYSYQSPVWGVHSIDASAMTGGNTLEIETHVDVATGRGTIRGMVGNNTVLLASAQIGVPIALAKTGSDLLSSGFGVLGGLANLATSVFTGNVAGSIGATESIISAGVSALPTASMRGADGSFSAFWFEGQDKMVAEFWMVVDDSPEHRGKPLCKERVLSTLPGYQVISDPDISFPCTADEQTQIKRYLESGYYYE